MSTASLTAPHAGSRDPGRLRALAERTLRESAHLLLDLPVGVVGFSVMVTALATGASLALTLVGVPLLAAALLLARHAARVERARARALLGVALAAPPARPAAPSPTARLLAPLRDRAAWRASGYFLLMLPAGTVTFTAAVAWWSSTLFLLTLPAWAWALPHGGPQVGDGSWWSAPWELAAASTCGVLLLAATPFVVRALTGIDRALLRLLDAR
jgi:hypothetical protein